MRIRTNVVECLVLLTGRYLTGKQCAMLSCCSRTFRDAADSEELWKVRLYSDFGRELVDQEAFKYEKVKNGHR